MSQSMYLTIYFRKEYNEFEFHKDLEKARGIFRAVWPKLGTGFDKDGNIKGLYEYYLNCDWDSDAKDLKEEKGELQIIHLDKPMGEEAYSFSFHNYGGHTDLYESVDLRDIYLVFAEILSSCFGYVVKVGESYDEKKYSVFFNEDGQKYQMVEDRSEYIKAIKNIVEAERYINRNQKVLEESKKLVESHEQTENATKKTKKN